MLSTSSIFLLPNRNNNSLPDYVKYDILKSVERDYKKEAPKFKEPNEDELHENPNNSGLEAEDKYADFIQKHSNEGSKAARETEKATIARVTEKIIERHPDCPSEKIEDRVIKESHNKYYSKEWEQEVLPKQEEWYTKKINEGIEATSEGEHVRSRDESEDSGMGFGDNDRFEGSFRTQSVVGSPGCESSDAPDNSPIATTEDSDSDSESKSPKDSHSELKNEDASNNDNVAKEDNEKSNSSSSNNKRSRSENSSEEPESKRPKTENNQSTIDYVLEKQATEMPDIFEADGGD
jgi:hypothetical protein